MAIVDDNGRLRGQRIAITGARGFIGSALAERLQGYGCTLELVSRESVPQDPTKVASNVCWLMRDLTKTEAWDDLLSRNDIVFHLSAHSDLYYAEQHPMENERANVLPIERLLAAARMTKGAPRTVIMASTATIVGMSKQVRVDDCTPDNPITVYDRGKKQCEELLSAAVKAGYLNAGSLRLANVFGFGARSHNKNRGFLNAMMEKAANGQPITLYGKGEFVRDFIHVDDVVTAFCSAAAVESGLDGAHYLIASGEGHTLREAMTVVGEEAKRAFGCVARIVEVPTPDGLHEIERRNFVGDSTRFERLTGWRHQVDLRTGIRRFMCRLSNTSSV